MTNLEVRLQADCAINSCANYSWRNLSPVYVHVSQIPFTDKYNLNDVLSLRVKGAVEQNFGEDVG